MTRAFRLVILILLAGGLTGTGVSAQEVNRKNLPTRELMQKKMMGRTTAETLTILGRPDSTFSGELQSGGKPYSQMWTYDCKNIDSATGKRDLMYLYFNSAGIVASISFTTSPMDLLLGAEQGTADLDKLLKKEQKKLK